MSKMTFLDAWLMATCGNHLMMVNQLTRETESGEGKAMPLVKGKSRAAVSQNIRTEISSGKPPRQAVAIALNTARRSSKGGLLGTLRPRKLK